MRTARERLTADEGFTLAEAIIYMMLLILVLGVVGSMLWSSQSVEAQVRSSTVATTEAQLAARSVESGIRNSRAFAIVNVGDDQLLIARTANTSDTVTWSCTYWYFSKANGSIRWTVMDEPVSGILPTPTASQIATWGVLTDGLRQSGTTKPFTVGSATTQLNIKFEAVADGDVETVITSSADSRAGKWEGAPCF